MATNEDILKYLNDMKNQANANNDALRRDVNEKLNIMTEKIDKVKKDAEEKDERNDIKMKGIIERLDSIENKFNDNKNKCEQNNEERKKQLERTKAFKESVGLVDKPEDTSRGKTWSELVDQIRKEEEEKREKEKLTKTKHWSKKIFAREKTKNQGEKEKLEEKMKVDNENEDEINRKVTEEKETEDLKLNKEALHDEADWSWDDSDLEWDGTVEKSKVQKKKNT